MKKSYNIRIKTESKYKNKHHQKSTTTYTFNSTILNHMHHNHIQSKATPNIVEPPLTQNRPQKYKNYYIDQQRYLGLSPFHTNHFKIQAYRQRLSLDFRKLHDTPQHEHESPISRIKHSQDVDRSLIAIKARMMTQNIYEQQLRVFEQERRLLGRINQRLAVLRDINEQKSELMRSYFILKK